MKPIKTEYEIITPEGKSQKVMRSRVFIPASVFDNKALLENDPTYIANLAMLPEAERDALLYGSWDSFDGQVFREWRNDPAHYKDMKWTHVIDPFPIPQSWKIYRGFDWGYSRPFSVGWYAADHEGKLYRIKEYYGCTGTPNTGIKINPAEVAKNIREIEDEDPLLKGREIVGVADPSIYEESRGESIAAMMARFPYAVYWSKGDNTRIPGKMQYHYRFAFDQEGDCMFQVFNTCKHFIRTLPSLVYDEKNVEDIDTDQEDHCLHGDTLVWTDQGKKKISDMVGTVGYVYSSDGNLHRYYDVRKTQSNAEVFNLTLEDGTVITATANHRFKLKDGSFKQLKDLTEDDELWEV